MRHYINATLIGAGFRAAGSASISGSGWAYAPGPGESVIPTALKGQGNFGTSEFFKKSMMGNIGNKEAKGREAYRKGLSGWEIEALEQEERMRGVGQSNH